MLKDCVRSPFCFGSRILSAKEYNYIINSIKSGLICILKVDCIAIYALSSSIEHDFVQNV